MTTRFVVAATDGSGLATRAVEWAAREAALRGAPLRIVSAVSLPRMITIQLQPERDAALGFVREAGDRALAAAAARAAEIAPGLVIDTVLAEGQAARMVTGSGSDALMLVVGGRGMGAFGAVMLGSVAEYAAGHASCPVVVIRGDAAPAHRLVGVGVGDLDNGTGAAAGALALAFAEAALRRADVRAIHAWHAPQGSVFWAGGGYPPPSSYAQAARARRRLAALMEGWAEKYPQMTVSWDVLTGHPARALADLSARTDLTVIGRAGRPADGPGPGSVRHALLRRARGPVAIVPSS